MASTNRLLRSLFVGVALISLGFSVKAQHAEFERYQESAGLTNMAARCLTQDPTGSLWVCTDNGLFRFDGFRFHREALPTAAGAGIYDMVADRQGSLWIASTHGLYVRRASQGQEPWLPVVSMEGPLLITVKGRIDVDTNGTLFAIDQNNRLWTAAVGTSDAQIIVAQPVTLPSFEGFRKTLDSESGPLQHVGDSLWFGCGSGLCEWRDGQLSTWGVRQGLPNLAWTSLLRGRDGTLWARSADALAELKPNSNRFKFIKAPRSRRWASYIALAEDSSGAILTATDDGLARWDGYRWQQWTPRQGLPDTHVRSLLFDAEGSLWVGTAGRGVHRWIGYGVADHWDVALGLPSPVVWAFARDGSNRLWAATAQGIAWYDEQSSTFHGLQSPKEATDSVFSLATDRSGNLWWMQGGRLMTLTPGSTRAEKVWEEPGFSNAMRGTDDVYLVEPHRLVKIEETSSTLRKTSLPSGLPRHGGSDRVVSDGSNDWITAGEGLYRLNGTTWTRLLDKSGLPIRVNHLASFFGSNQLWVEDEQGLALYSIEDSIAHLSIRIASSNFGVAKGLFLHADPTGNLWYGTDGGLFVLRNNVWSHIDKTNGLLFDDIDTHAFMLDSDGTSWIGTSSGVTRLRPARTSTDPVTLRLDKFEFGASSSSALPAAPIPWKDRNLRITVGTSNIAQGSSTRIEYRIRTDSPWLAVEGNVIQPGALAFDSYVMEVRASAKLPIDEAGPVLRIPITVAPPWWFSKPALLGYVFAGLGSWWLSILLFRRRAQASRVALHKAIALRTSELEQSREMLRNLGYHNARALETERKRVARELHDEMGQQLAALRMEISVLHFRSRANEQLPAMLLGEWLEMLLERVDGLVVSVRSLVSQLRPLALDAGLVTALEWLQSEFISSSSIPCRTYVDKDARYLPADFATAIFRIAQESLTNVRKHARARQVAVRLRHDLNHWELTVADDGSGFDTQSNHPGHGLLGMVERAQMLGGVLSIESAKGVGTTVRFRLSDLTGLDAGPRSAFVAGN